jgi:hypothetical protein
VVISGAELRDMVFVASAFLEKNRKAIDALNVFPVPDGDTGINMSLTMQMAAKEVREAKAETVQQVADAVAMGSLKGARGNSGVILSQVFRGFSKGLAGLKAMDGKALALAMQMGVEAAYKAVMRPKEGTILTVSRIMAEAAKKAADAGGDPLQVLDAMLTEGEIVLQKTPDMLPVLKEAGVVDAGGMGLLIIFRGFKMSLDGEEVPEEEIVSLGSYVVPSTEETADLEFTYCTEFFIKNKEGNLGDDDALRLRSMLEKIGDCVLVVGEGALFKVHVHSNTPGKALQYGLRFGMLSNIKIDNMTEQHRSIMDVDPGMMQTAPKAPAKPLGIVAVAAGDGLSEIFRELGIDVVVEGGQSMNPSIEDLSAAIDAVNADCVIVLPNNKNIILAAQQAAQLHEEKRVEVIPSLSIPQGIAAAIAFNPDEDANAIIEAMLASLDIVHSCLVTFAVRDTTLNGKKIKQGDILGMIDGDLVQSGSGIDEVSIELLKKAVKKEHETISMFYGNEIDKDKAEGLAGKIEETFPDCEVQVYNGGQPLYYYIFGVE